MSSLTVSPQQHQFTELVQQQQQQQQQQHHQQHEATAIAPSPPPELDSECDEPPTANTVPHPLVDSISSEHHQPLLNSSDDRLQDRLNPLGCNDALNANAFNQTTSRPPLGKLSKAQLEKLDSLTRIIKSGDYKDFTELLQVRGLKSLLNVFIDGQTALHHSLINGRSVAWCKQLVNNGANPNLANLAGWHPIHLAAFNGSRETMRYLIECVDWK